MNLDLNASFQSPQSWTTTTDCLSTSASPTSKMPLFLSLPLQVSSDASVAPLTSSTQLISFDDHVVHRSCCNEQPVVPSCPCSRVSFLIECGGVDQTQDVQQEQDQGQNQSMQTTAAAAATTPIPMQKSVANSWQQRRLEAENKGTKWLLKQLTMQNRSCCESCRGIIDVALNTVQFS